MDEEERMAWWEEYVIDKDDDPKVQEFLRQHYREHLREVDGSDLSDPVVGSQVWDFIKASTQRRAPNSTTTFTRG